MAVINEDLDIPDVRATLIVTSQRKFWFFGEYTWLVKMIMYGPNARYNSAEKYYTPSQLVGLTCVLQRSLLKMEVLLEKNINGTYIENMGQNVFVETTSNGPQLKFSLSSGTYNFFRYWSLDQTRAIIDLLNSLPHRAIHLSEGFH